MCFEEASRALLCDESEGKLKHHQIYSRPFNDFDIKTTQRLMKGGRESQRKENERQVPFLLTRYH